VRPSGEDVGFPCAAACGGRNTHESVLIHDDRSPLAARRRRDDHISEAKRGQAVHVEEAIARARVRPMCVERRPRHTRLAS
jgi:hypothetical protein